MATLNGKNIWGFEKPSHLFEQGVSKCTPVFGLFLKIFHKNLSFHLFPLGKAKLSGVFEKFFVLQKILSLIWTKGVEMHTHFWDFPRQIFYLPKISPHLFGIAKPNDTLFYRKRRKNFFGCGCFILLPSKSLFTYSHWEGANSNPVSKNILLFVKTSSLIPTERSQMHTLNLKKFFIPTLIWNWEAETHPVFTKILKKFFR